MCYLFMLTFAFTDASRVQQRQKLTGWVVNLNETGSILAQKLFNGKVEAIS
ncbi:MAG: hypothetical protein LBK62_01035 [Treponema sp.]|nr:hypothetical protein [Treponema sp.]